MQTQSEVLAKLTALAEEDDDIEVLWLYGSRQKGKQRFDSDYDLAVAFNDFDLDPLTKFTRPNELALEWSHKLGLPESMVSLVDINSVPIYLAYNIIETGLVLYEGHSSRLYREIVRINSMYEYQLIQNEKYDGQK